MSSLLSTVECRAASFRPDGEIFFSLEERLAENFPMFGFGGAAMGRGPLLQRANDLRADVSNGQLSHPSCLQSDAFIVCNKPSSRTCGSGARSKLSHERLDATRPICREPRRPAR